MWHWEGYSPLCVLWFTTTQAITVHLLDPHGWQTFQTGDSLCDPGQTSKHLFITEHKCKVTDNVGYAAYPGARV